MTRFPPEKVTTALTGGPQEPLWVDELLVSHQTAVAGVQVVNAGREPFVAYLLSGPDLHPEAAALGAIW